MMSRYLLLVRNRVTCIRLLLSATLLGTTLGLLYFWSNISSGLDLDIKSKEETLKGNLGSSATELDTSDIITTTEASDYGDNIDLDTEDGDNGEDIAESDSPEYRPDDAVVVQNVEGVEKDVEDFEKSLSEWEQRYKAENKGLFMAETLDSFPAEDFDALFGPEEPGETIGFSTDDDPEDHTLQEDMRPSGLGGVPPPGGVEGMLEALQQEAEVPEGEIVDHRTPEEMEEQKLMDVEDYEDVDVEGSPADVTTVGPPDDNAVDFQSTTEEPGEEDEARRELREKMKDMSKEERRQFRLESADSHLNEFQKEVDATREEQGSAISTEIQSTQVQNFRATLEQHASEDKKIFLLLTDSRYTLMVLNFYETSVVQLGLKNVLFGTMDRALCGKLQALNIPCVYYERLAESLRYAPPGNDSDIYRHHLFYKLRMIFETVSLGYTVLYTEVDSVVLKNPFTDMENFCGDECDVALPMTNKEKHHVSLSLAYARPTENAKFFFYDLILKLAEKNMAIPQKWIFNLHRADRLNLLLLGKRKYPHGRDFFLTRKFATINPCKECVAVINDEVFTREAKIYRFKEMHFWNLNIEGYYTDTKRQYIMFDNPYTFGNSTETMIEELKALRNALAMGQILQRFVILPRFHCVAQEDIDNEIQYCNLHDVLRLEEFQQSFMGRYREHAFLWHHKVPSKVRKSHSPLYYIGDRKPKDLGQDRQFTDEEVTVVRPRLPAMGADSAEVRKFFEADKSRVLRFHSLYNSFSHFWSDDIAHDFNKRLKHGFEYRKRIKYSLRQLQLSKPEAKPMGGAGGAGGGGAPQSKEIEKLKAMMQAAQAT